MNWNKTKGSITVQTTLIAKKKMHVKIAEKQGGRVLVINSISIVRTYLVSKV